MGDAAVPASNGGANKQLIDMLRRSRLFRDYGTVFTKATGLPLTLRPLDFWQLAHHGKKHENPFCALLAENPATLSVCLQAHDDMIRHTGGIATYGDLSVRLNRNGCSGEAGSEDDRIFTNRASVVAHAGEIRHDQGRSRIRATWPAINRRTSQSVGEKPADYAGQIQCDCPIITFFAAQLSALTNEIVLESQNAEPPLVQKARDYIAQHKTEPLSLSAVAKAAGASVFHFCKVFHKATGLKFTDYVARVRLEEARTQLLNPNRRISEVAYDVGFQSLTQFNRMFKRVFGQSPSEFRQHLATGKRTSKAERRTGAELR